MVPIQPQAVQQHAYEHSMVGSQHSDASATYRAIPDLSLETLDHHHDYLFSVHITCH
jgi:hypothetical protein